MVETNYTSTVRDAMDAWLHKHGRSDPRPMLDSMFYSYLFIRDYRGFHNYSEIDEWCNDQLGEENWYRQFNKLWFTSDSELVMFKLAWGGELA